MLGSYTQFHHGVYLKLVSEYRHNLIYCLHVNLTERHPEQSGMPQRGTQNSHCYLPITLQMWCEIQGALNVCRLADPSPASRTSWDVIGKLLFIGLSSQDAVQPPA